MLSKLTALAIAAGVLATPTFAETFVVIDSQPAPLVLHRVDGTHRVTFANCAVEFDTAWVATGTEGVCDAMQMEIAGNIVHMQSPEPYVAGTVVARDVSPVLINP